MCAVCYGGGCPVCEDYPTMITCPDCNGTRVVPYHEDYGYTPKEYAALSKDDKDTCEKCDREGEIIKPVNNLFYT